MSSYSAAIAGAAAACCASRIDARARSNAALSRPCASPRRARDALRRAVVRVEQRHDVAREARRARDARGAGHDRVDEHLVRGPRAAARARSPAARGCASAANARDVERADRGRHERRAPARAGSRHRGGARRVLLLARPRASSRAIASCARRSARRRASRTRAAALAGLGSPRAPPSCRGSPPWPRSGRPPSPLGAEEVRQLDDPHRLGGTPGKRRRRLRRGPPSCLYAAPWRATRRAAGALRWSAAAPCGAQDAPHPGLLQQAASQTSSSMLGAVWALRGASDAPRHHMGGRERRRSDLSGRAGPRGLLVPTARRADGVFRRGSTRGACGSTARASRACTSRSSHGST